jgi:hypothetical protein
MKKLVIIFLLSLTALHAQTIEKNDLTHMGKVFSKQYKPHPRLLLLKGEENDILRAINRNPEWARIHQEILAECDKIIGMPPVERIKIGRRLLDKSRECLRRVFQLSYAYRTTGDEKYLKRAELELLAVSAFEDWNPTHFLDVAEMTMAVSIGYDWLFDRLSTQSRQIIRDAIISKGIEPSFDDKYNSFLKAEHNWNQVCNAGMTFGALAIAEDHRELAEKVIRRAVETIPKAMKTSYQPDGAYPEGFGYWDYGTSFNVLFLSAVEKALGTDFGLSAMPGFLKTAGFVEHIVGPIGLAHNWGDSGNREGLNPAIFWFAEKTRNPSLLWGQKTMLSGASSGFVGNRIAPALMIWGSKIDIKSIKEPRNKVWVGQGQNPVAMMRTSWTDPNAIFVGFKAGSPSVNHGHMDVGSFVLDAMGERWAMDFGMQNYNSLETNGVDLWNKSQNSERWQVFRLNTQAHNTLSFDGQQQLVKGYAKIDSWSDKAGDLAAVTDLSKLYQDQVESVKRGIAIHENSFVVVRDEVRAGAKQATMRWNLLTAASVKILDAKTVELSQNNKKMYLIFDTKLSINIKTWSTTPTHAYDAANPGTQFVGFETTLSANSTNSFNAYFSTLKPVMNTKPLSEWSVKQ